MKCSCTLNEVNDDYKTCSCAYGRRGGWRHRHKEESKNNYRRGKSNWLKDYIVVGDIPTSLSTEKFRRRFEVPQRLHQQLKWNLLEQRPECWEIRTIGRYGLGKRTEVKMLNCFNMLSSGNRADRNDDVTHMAKETGRQYFLQFCKGVVEMYLQTYWKSL